MLISSRNTDTLRMFDQMCRHFGTSQWLYLRSMLYPAITLFNFLVSYEDYHTQGKDWSSRLSFGPKMAQYRFLGQKDLRKYLTPECFSCVNHPRLIPMWKTRVRWTPKSSNFLRGEQEPNGREWAELLSIVFRKQFSQPPNITTNQPTSQSLNNQLTTYQPIKNQPTNQEPTNQPTTHPPTNRLANQHNQSCYWVESTNSLISDFWRFFLTSRWCNR